jgi:hypothetical protein
MARQGGFVKIKGTLGGMTFYNSSLDGSLIREKGGVDGSRIASDPAFARTRENGAEFGTAGSSGKLFRDTLRNLMLNASDNRVTSRVTKVMSMIQKLDGTSARGARNVAVGLQGDEAKNLLRGFNFNINSSLGSVLFKPVELDPVTGVISIADLLPVNDIVAPDGATHASLKGGVAVIDFATGDSELALTNTQNVLLGNVSSDVTLTPVSVPAGTGIKFFLMKIEFFQLVNGVQYSLNNGAFNALTILEVA